MQFLHDFYDKHVFVKPSHIRWTFTDFHVDFVERCGFIDFSEAFRNAATNYEMSAGIRFYENLKIENLSTVSKC